MNFEINFDMDGTIVDFYGVNGWLDDLENSCARPYVVAKPMCNMSALAKQIHRLQAKGYKVNIISWCSKSGTKDFNLEIEKAKRAWLKKHLPSVTFDKITIVRYGTPKQTLGTGILFDDEEPNRKNWGVNAYTEKDIFNILKNL